MTCLEPHWTTLFSALLMPVVALVGVCIAWQQCCIAKNKLKLELFEKRFAVYDKARNMLGEIMIKGKLTDAGLHEYGSGIREARWLMDEEVAKYLNQELWDKAVQLQSYDAQLDGLPVGEERDHLAHERATLNQWFHTQYPILDEKVAPFLKLSH